MENPTITAGKRPGEFLLSEDGKTAKVFCAPGATEADALAVYRATGQVPADVLRAQLARDALQRVDDLHGDLLGQLTKRASTQERDTWKPKSEAARAYLADSATDAQTRMIEIEASGGDGSAADLSRRIIAYDDAFHIATGAAGKWRAEAQTAVRVAVADAVPVGEIPGQLKTAFVGINDGMQRLLEAAANAT
jgi:hypothetical protein